MQLLLISRLAVLVFALFSGVWSIALIKIGIDINWLFFVIGLLVASVFPPISFLITWNAVPKVSSLSQGPSLLEDPLFLSAYVQTVVINYTSILPHMCAIMSLKCCALLHSISTSRQQNAHLNFPGCLHYCVACS